MQGSTGVEISDVSLDSRAVQSGTAFIAVKGSATDGHQFIEKAIEKGATAIIAEQLPGEKKAGVVYVEVENSAIAAGYMASNFFGQPWWVLRAPTAKQPSPRYCTNSLPHSVITAD